MSVHPSGILVDARQPSQRTDEVAVGIRDRLDTLALLSEIPTAECLVVTDTEKVLAARMEDYRTNPIVMT